MTAYPVAVYGGCLGEWIPDGTVLSVEPFAPIKPMMPVFVRFSGGPWGAFVGEHPGEFDGAGKLYLGTVGKVVLLGQCSPPLVAFVDEADIASMHAVTGADGARKPTAADLHAMSALAMFCGTERDPIASEWTPGTSDNAAYRKGGFDVAA